MAEAAINKLRLFITKNFIRDLVNDSSMKNSFLNLFNPILKTHEKLVLFKKFKVYST